MSMTTPAAGGASVWQVAVFEGRRLLRHPLNLFGMVLSLAVFWLATRGTAPVLERDVIILVGSSLALAATALLTAETAASRNDRYDTAEVVEPTPADPDHWFVGMAVAAWAPVGLSLTVLALGLLWLYTDSPAGSIPWFELAGAPAVVALGHTIGVVIGRWVRILLAGPIAILIVGGIYVLREACIGCEGVVPPPSPFLPWHGSQYDLPQTAGRLEPVHLLYIVGLTVLFAAVAARRWKTAALSALIAAAAAIGLTGTPNDGEAIVARGNQWATRVDPVCETRNSVEYCALPGFAVWVDRWEQELLGNGPLEGDHGVQVAERRHDARVRVVVSRHVDCLERGYRTVSAGGDPLFKRAHLGGQGRLISYGGGHPAQ